MNWLKHIFILGLLFSLNSHSQENNTWENNFDHFKGDYEDYFTFNQMYSWRVKRRATNFPYGLNCGFISTSLLKNGDYQIVIEFVKFKNDSLIEESYLFKGNYTIDAFGNLTLIGEHPFKENILKINEKTKGSRKEPYVSDRSLTYRFNAQFKWITNKKRRTNCDGCRLMPDD